MRPLVIALTDPETGATKWEFTDEQHPIESAVSNLPNELQRKSCKFDDHGTGFRFSEDSSQESLHSHQELRAAALKRYEELAEGRLDQLAGTAIYMDLVHEYGARTGRVVGVLLEMREDELARALRDPDYLRARAHEADLILDEAAAARIIIEAVLHEEALRADALITGAVDSSKQPISSDKDGDDVPHAASGNRETTGDNADYEPRHALARELGDQRTGGWVKRGGDLDDTDSEEEPVVRTWTLRARDRP